MVKLAAILCMHLPIIEVAESPNGCISDLSVLRSAQCYGERKRRLGELTGQSLYKGQRSLCPSALNTYMAIRNV